MVRPKKDEYLRKSKRINLRLDEDQYDIIEGYANAANLTISEYIRQQAVHGKVNISCPIYVDMDQVHEVVQELSAIGNNLNQIAVYFHIGGSKTEAVRDAIYEAICLVRKTCRELTKKLGEYHGDLETLCK